MRLERITKFNILEKFAELPPGYLDVEQFFGNQYTLDTILNHMGNDLYLCSNDNEIYLVQMKKAKNEYRFLFKEPTKEFLNAFLEEFKPRYVGANCLPKESSVEVRKSEDEIILEIQRVLNLENADFRKNYNRAIRKNPKFLVSHYNYKKDIGDLLEFLETWRYTRSDKLNTYAHIENDMNFLTVYGRENFVKGVVIRSEEKIIAYCIFIPHLPDTCISFYSKVLRGYENLGTILTVEKCKYMKECGYSFALLGGSNNSFKESLVWAGKIKKVYNAEIFSVPGMVFKKREDYVGVLVV